MIREERKKKRKRKLFLKIFFGTVCITGLAALIVLTVFRTKTVEIEGNEIYDQAAISDTVFSDEYCQNSLYLFVKYNFLEKQPMPFIDTLEISFLSPSHVKITVYEKAMIGYIYDEETGTYHYFDKDGIIVEQSQSRLDGVTQVEGLSYEALELYQVMELEDDTILDYLLVLTQNLEKYGISADKITVSGKGRMNVTVGNITIKMGKNNLTEEKIMRLQKILPQLSDKTGSLDLQEWSESNSEIIFKEETAQ